MSEPFNFEDALKDLQSGKDLTGKDGVLMPLHQKTRRSCDECRTRASHRN